MGCKSSKDAAKKEDPDPKPEGAEAAAEAPKQEITAPPEDKLQDYSAEPASPEQQQAATKIQAIHKGKSVRAAKGKDAATDGKPAPPGQPFIKADTAKSGSALEAGAGSTEAAGSAAAAAGSAAAAGDATRELKVKADWTVDEGKKEAHAAFLWAAGSTDVSQMIAKHEIDLTKTDPGTCKDLVGLTGAMLCKEEAYPDNFGDGEECDKIRVAMTQVAITFMRDQCTCKETYKPPSELAEQLAVWLWDSARVEQWLKEDVGILEEAEPQLYGGKVDGKLLLMKFEEGLFEGVEFEDGQKGQDMVRENLEGQCLSFFDVCVDEITGAADGEPAP